MNSSQSAKIKCANVTKKSAPKIRIIGDHNVPDSNPTSTKNSSTIPILKKCSVIMK